MAEQVDEKTGEVYEAQAQTVGLSTQAVLLKAELDQQITTAKAFPRSISRFLNELRDMVIVNADVAEACIFALPRAGKTIEGASIRFAELAISAWGNCRVMSRVVRVDERTVVAQGVFHDLERNSAISDETERSIIGRKGRFNADMIVVTGNAARAIARRNAALQGIPRAYWEPIYLEARRVVAGDVKTLANRRADALAYLQKLGVTVEMVLATLEVAGVEDIGQEELVTLKATARQIRDGEITVEEAFIDPSKRKAEPNAGAEAPGIAGLKAAVGSDSTATAAPVFSAPELPSKPKPNPKTSGELEKEFIERRSKEIREEITRAGIGTFEEQLVEIERRMKLVPAEWEAAKKA